VFDEASWLCEMPTLKLLHSLILGAFELLSVTVIEGKIEGTKITMKETLAATG